MRSLTTGPDAQWAAARDGKTVVLLAGGAAPPVGQLELPTDDCDIALVGPPTVLAVVSRTPARVTLYEPPYLEAVASLDLEAPARLVATIGPRLVLVDADAKQLIVVRTQGRALSMQKIDPGNPIELAVGLERNQVLLVLPKKLEVWDGVSGRPLLRPQLALPPPPRTVGAAQGHLWATRPNSDEVFVYRLSDGRPFRHYVGAPVESVVSHPASPLIVLVTPRGLVRLHCFAHSLLLVDGAPYTPGTPLALLVHGEDIALIGMPESGEPWGITLGGHTSPQIVEPPPESDTPALVTAADKLRAMRAAAVDASGTAAPAGESRTIAAEPRSGVPGARGWRDALATFGAELARGVDGELPIVAVDTELGELAQRLGLSAAARRALIALYALYLVGEPAFPIARLAKALGDWTEPLGQGDLAALALVDKTGGKVGLRRPLSELLDGAAPLAVRLVGGGPSTPRAGAYRVSRDARADAAIETELATLLGRIAVVEGDLATGLVEARLHGATAVSFAPPADKPRPWPRGAGLVLVLYGTQTAWVADLPTLATVS
ncbi:MAG: hypothetical protein JO257_33665 [Deltaproteobacteria bacterium]|nr:hypothetical protein [Deltaproteobacteria bacterium]